MFARVIHYGSFPNGLVSVQEEFVKRVLRVVANLRLALTLSHRPLSPIGEGGAKRQVRCQETRGGTYELED